MWDFSWLINHHPGGAFADWDRCLDEAVERGFTAIRIDAYPLIVGRLIHPGDAVTIAAKPNETWGFSDKPYRHHVAEELVEFCRKASARGLWLILSSWGSGCVEISDPKAALAADPLLLAQCWERTLRLLGEAGVLDRVLYVDLDQEFPFFSPYQAELNRLGNEVQAGEDPMVAAGRRDGVPGKAWNAAQQRHVRHVWNTAIGALQELFPGLRFTISLTAFVPDVRALGLAVPDVLELHFWIHHPRFDRRTGFYRDLIKDRTNREASGYQRHIDETLRSSGVALWNQLRNQVAFGRAWADELGVPLTTTEAWGPWWHMDAEGLRWDWLQAWCERGHGELAREFGLWSSTPWNYCHPYWSTWAEVAWYRRVNAAFTA